MRALYQNFNGKETVLPPAPPAAGYPHCVLDEVAFELGKLPVFWQAFLLIHHPILLWVLLPGLAIALLGTEFQ
jgi:hypothetical protein